VKALLQKIIAKACHSFVGRETVRFFCALTQYRVFAPRTMTLMRMDLARLTARTRARGLKASVPTSSRLHLGCGSRTIPGWLNVDVAKSDHDVDLVEPLPWADGHFRVIVSQHVIEHLELETELVPLLRELRRVADPDCEVWLSCPDLEKVCRGYIEDKGRGLIEDRETRMHTDLGLNGIPPQHIINRLFHQSGEHKNLFDFELLEWALRRAGFRDCGRAVEQDLLDRFPEFLPRRDDFVTLYVRATP
jgi:predicted SAM-dependent methyltransferase